MSNYVPPFEITSEMLLKVSSIMKKVGKLDNYNELNKMPILRRNTRIESIHSSLAIEANSLSLDEVRDVIDGKSVLGPEKEIIEVKNAYSAYQKISEVDPYSIKDLKELHGIMTQNIVKESGKFRSGNEGVFDENGECIHVCPSPENLDKLMSDLFSFMKDSKDKVHPLILSCIFHYEFVFIHPFSDGNGRMARLWQNVILSHWERVFEYVPIESQIMKYQDKYYEAIKDSNIKGESTSFIEFMLLMIDETLDNILTGVNNEINHISIYVKKLLEVMEPGIRYTAKELMDLLNMKSRVSFRDNYLSPALDSDVVKMSYPNNKTNKNQTYYID